MPSPFLLATSLLALSACGGSPANQAAPPANRPTVEIAPSAPGQPPATIDVRTPEGQAAIRAGGNAAPFPDGLPRYPGATDDQSVNVSSNAGQGGSSILGFRTADPVAQVIAFYADAATRAGYRIIVRTEGTPTSMIVVQKGDANGISISATRIGNYTQAQIIAAGR